MHCHRWTFICHCNIARCSLMFLPAVKKCSNDYPLSEMIKSTAPVRDNNCRRQQCPLIVEIELFHCRRRCCIYANTVWRDGGDQHCKSCVAVAENKAATVATREELSDRQDSILFWMVLMLQRRQFIANRGKDTTAYLKVKNIELKMSRKGRTTLSPSVCVVSIQ